VSTSHTLHPTPHPPASHNTHSRTFCFVWLDPPYSIISWLYTYILWFMSYVVLQRTLLKGVRRKWESPRDVILFLLLLLLLAFAGRCLKVHSAVCEFCTLNSRSLNENLSIVICRHWYTDPKPNIFSLDL